MKRSKAVLFSLLFLPLISQADFKSAMTAAADGRVQALKTELRKNPSLAKKSDDKGDTLLLAAVAGEHMASVEAVLQHKPELKHKNKDHFGALDLALMTGSEEIALRLLKAGVIPQQSDILLAAEKNMAQVIEKLLAKNKKFLDYVDAEGNSALHIAALNGSGEAVKKLLSAGAKTALKNKKAQTPADLARMNHHSQTETLLK